MTNPNFVWPDISFDETIIDLKAAIKESEAQRDELHRRLRDAQLRDTTDARFHHRVRVAMSAIESDSALPSDLVSRNLIWRFVMSTLVTDDYMAELSKEMRP